jgi:hypothetical protein
VRRRSARANIYLNFVRLGFWWEGRCLFGWLFRKGVKEVSKVEPKFESKIEDQESARMKECS